MMYIYITYVCFRVPCEPPPPPMADPGPGHTVPPLGLFKAAYLPYLPLFPHVVRFLANTMQNNTACKD